MAQPQLFGNKDVGKDLHGTAIAEFFPYGVGIDTHSKFIQVAVLVRKEAQLVRFENEFLTTQAGFKKARSFIYAHLPGYKSDHDDTNLRYVIESTGNYHMPVVLYLKGKPSIINPHLAGSTKRKSDVLDARGLAYHSITGLWPASYVPSTLIQTLRVLLGMRNEAARCATRCTNRINNNFLRFGHTFGRDASMRDAIGRALAEDLIQGRIPKHDAVSSEGLPAAVRSAFEEEYGRYDTNVELATNFMRQALEHVKTNSWPTGVGKISGKRLLLVLESVPGIGPVGALTWLAWIGDPARFASKDQVAAFVGSDPSLKVSAGKVTTHIKRKGEKHLHRILKMAAASLIRRKDTHIGRWGFSLAARSAKGGFGRAVNAVARRIGIFMWHVHSRGEPFDVEKYSFYLTVRVRDIPVADMGLSKLFTQRLREAGFGTSQELADALYTTLPQQKGIGATCLQKIHEWIRENQLKA